MIMHEGRPMIPAGTAIRLALEFRILTYPYDESDKKYLAQELRAGRKIPPDRWLCDMLATIFAELRIFEMQDYLREKIFTKEPSAFDMGLTNDTTNKETASQFLANGTVGKF